MDTDTGYNASTNTYPFLNSLRGFKERISYDANGNIMTYVRSNKGYDAEMDDLSYKYYPGTNQLRQVTDQIPATKWGVNSWDPVIDIDNQSSETNYIYDAIGNLTSDVSENIIEIKWNVYGKIKEITRNATARNPITKISFIYDALGNRIGKIAESGTNKAYTWYVRDAIGNLMGVYTANGSSTNLSSLDLNQTEKYIYGNKLIGVETKSQGVDGGPWNAGLYYSNGLFERGRRYYELSNHLDHVLATISDKKYGISSNSTIIDYFEPDMLGATEYYSYGMPMRIAGSPTGTNYRFGFGSHDKDDDLKVVGNHVSFNDYGYDPRLGRRWQIDPVEQVQISGYAVFKNNPNFYADPDGESPISMFIKAVAKAGIKKAAKEFVENQIKKKLAAYTSKNWGKQLFNDALDFVDATTSTAWYEYVIEVIPVVGDVYGASKLGKQGYKLWKGLEKFEKVAELGTKAANKAWKNLGDNANVTGKGKDILDKFITKFNNQGKGLNADDLGGAVKEKFGLSSNGNHLSEATEALSGMQTQINKFTEQIFSDKMDGEVLRAAKGVLNDVQKQYDTIKKALKEADKAVEKLGKIE